MDQYLIPRLRDWKAKLALRGLTGLDLEDQPARDDDSDDPDGSDGCDDEVVTQTSGP